MNSPSTSCAWFVKDKEEAQKAALVADPRRSFGRSAGDCYREADRTDRRASEEGIEGIQKHWDPDLKPEDRKQRLMDEMTSGLAGDGTNALSADEGVFVNIDGTGNRVGAMAWAPGKLLYILGINKITPDLERPRSKRARTGYAAKCDPSERQDPMRCRLGIA